MGGHRLWRAGVRSEAEEPIDIEVNRLWEDDVLEGLRAHKWLNIEDFDKAISIARKRFPEPPRKIAPPEDTVAPALPIAPAPPIEPLPQTPKQVATPEAPRPRKVDPVEPPPAPPVAQQAPAIKKPDSEPTKPVPPKFHMLFSGYAKFIRPWRVRMRK
jgi:hypothetical protein